MSAEAGEVCGAEYGEHGHERVKSRNGLPRLGHPRRHRRVVRPDAMTGLALPGQGVAAPSPRRAGLVSAMATSYPLGVSTRRVETLVEQLGIKSLSKVRPRRCPGAWMPRSRRSATGPWTPRKRGVDSRPSVREACTLGPATGSFVDALQSVAASERSAVHNRRRLARSMAGRGVAVMTF
ncbi:hypothetical protein JIG36_05640 [Actinoplanes sp. LDG1-06]|uniref:Transposase n=1 Tax=Paractinoplanes ovalisporus TaxID=2810368 RepID=A0ABS2A5C8_9ACTN|nr:hypothetical protein [Actinoplanes ovalisporus]